MRTAATTRRTARRSRAPPALPPTRGRPTAGLRRAAAPGRPPGPRLLDGALHGPLPGLRRPAGEPAAVVRQLQPDADEPAVPGGSGGLVHVVRQAHALPALSPLSSLGVASSASARSAGPSAASVPSTSVSSGSDAVASAAVSAVLSSTSEPSTSEPSTAEPSTLSSTTPVPAADAAGADAPAPPAARVRARRD